MTAHDEMCHCAQCMSDDYDRTLQRAGDLERENARLRGALEAVVENLRVPHNPAPWAFLALEVAQRALEEGGPS
jgi:hypothetical protein